jgi:Spy/CpxP family protein refolding chaperone
MNKTSAAVVIAALFAGGTLVALADDDRHEGGEGYRHGHEHDGDHHGRGHRGHGHDRCRFDSERGVEHMSRVLKLDEQQTEKVRTIAKRYDKELDALRDKTRDSRQQLHALMAKGPANEAEVRTLAEAQGKLKADRLVLRTRMQREIDQVLTKEQREKHQQMRESFGRRHS